MGCCGEFWNICIMDTLGMGLKSKHELYFCFLYPLLEGNFISCSISVSPEGFLAHETDMDFSVTSVTLEYRRFKF